MDDSVYIKKILNGDNDAFRFIINKYKDMAYSFVMSIVKDEFIAQDVIQTTFIRAYTKLHTFKGNSKFSSWLYRIAVNEAFKVLNRRKKEFVFYEESDLETIIDIDDFTIKVNEEYQKHFINEALKKLKPKESLILRLFYLEEHNIKDIMEITGWTNTSIKVLLHRARLNMKKILEVYYNNKTF